MRMKFQDTMMFRIFVICKNMSKYDILHEYRYTYPLFYMF